MEKPDKITNRVLYGVDAVIFNESGQILMLKRDVKEEQFQTGWEFVKGALKVDEDYLEAALREIKEETGVTVEVLGEIGELFEVDARYRKKAHYDFVKKKVYVFLFRGGDAKIDKSEHKEYRWMSFEEAVEKVWVEFGKEILEKSKVIFDQRQ